MHDRDAAPGRGDGPRRGAARGDREGRPREASGRRPCVAPSRRRSLPGATATGHDTQDAPLERVGRRARRGRPRRRRRAPPGAGRRPGYAAPGRIARGRGRTRATEPAHRRPRAVHRPRGPRPSRSRPEPPRLDRPALGPPRCGPRCRRPSPGWGGGPDAPRPGEPDRRHPHPVRRRDQRRRRRLGAVVGASGDHARPPSARRRPIRRRCERSRDGRSGHDRTGARDRACGPGSAGRQRAPIMGAGDGGRLGRPRRGAAEPQPRPDRGALRGGHPEGARRHPRDADPARHRSRPGRPPARARFRGSAGGPDRDRPPGDASARHGSRRCVRAARLESGLDVARTLAQERPGLAFVRQHAHRDGLDPGHGGPSRLGASAPGLPARAPGVARLVPAPDGRERPRRAGASGPSRDRRDRRAGRRHRDPGGRRVMAARAVPGRRSCATRCGRPAMPSTPSRRPRTGRACRRRLERWHPRCGTGWMPSARASTCSATCRTCIRPDRACT